MSFVHDATGRALAAALDLRHRRQELLAGNIANADTPGYEPVDLAFEGALRDAVEAEEASPPGFERTDADHLGGTMLADPAEAEVVLRRDVTNTLDENGVDTDVEMARLADNALRYETTVEITRRRLAMLFDVIARTTGG